MRRECWERWERWATPALARRGQEAQEAQEADCLKVALQGAELQVQGLNMALAQGDRRRVELEMVGAGSRGHVKAFFSK